MLCLRRAAVSSTRSTIASSAFRRSYTPPSTFQRPLLSRTVPVIVRTTPSRRWASTAAAENPVEPPDYLSEGELKVFNMIKDEFQPVSLSVQDVSGGCGSMYALDIVSPRFKGLSVIKQHRLVNAALRDEIKKWHGVQLKTKAP